MRAGTRKTYLKEGKFYCLGKMTFEKIAKQVNEVRKLLGKDEVSIDNSFQIVKVYKYTNTIQLSHPASNHRIVVRCQSILQ
ncbi:hypothetical protein P4H66_06185 [Paenibacillus dokdonensis]|uniref:Uncharacterized protein n=1 Tax=Paenibacillus dokdonensis TaxID=2567944 RepID=A0ABU6GJ23_9BACL|nr:hypothetical protein [Paenibacillus dokdonensis]MEC0239443.1 hypothetical protein [Paenibacillus dokdonensis]